MTRSVLFVYALFDRQRFEILEHRPFLNSVVKHQTLNQEAGVFVCVSVCVCVGGAQFTSLLV